MPFKPSSWKKSFEAFLHPRVVTMLFYGFSAGIPLLLIFSSLSLWLREAGIERSTVTYFSWAALAYSFKFVWAPLIDQLPVPFLTRWLGRRRAWLATSQVAVAASIFLISCINPAQPEALTVMALAAIALGFSAATQDIVIDAYRIESAGDELQAMMSSTYIAGYRIGMLVSGAGSLVLASVLGSTSDHYSFSAWGMTYAIMSLTMLVGLVTTFLVPEPERTVQRRRYKNRQYIKVLGVFLLGVVAFVVSYLLTAQAAEMAKSALTALSGNDALSSLLVEAVRLSIGIGVAMFVVRVLAKTPLYEQQLVEDSYLEPIRDFFRRYGVSLAWLLLAFIGLYRISDIVLGVISNVFYEDMGFTKVEIAEVVKSFGLFMTIAGGFLGGILSVRIGVMRTLLIGAILAPITNLLFVWLAYSGHDMTLFYAVISADNLTAGLASAAFVAFLSRLTNISFTASQYAIFSSLMTLIPKTLGGYSGSMVDNMGYPAFFLITALLGVPVLVLIVLLRRYTRFAE